MKTSRHWTAHYGDAPSSLEYPSWTLYQALLETAAEHPDQIAIYYAGSRIRYDRLAKTTAVVAAGLAEVGVHRGDRIACLLPNGPHAVVMLYAANALGAVVSFLPPEPPGHILEHCFAHLQPSWAVVTAEAIASLSRHHGTRRLQGVLTTSASDYAPHRRLRRMMFRARRCGRKTGGRKTGPPAAGVAESRELPPVFAWTTVVAKGADAQFATKQPERNGHERFGGGDPQTVAVIAFTQGATGAPKSVMLSSANLNAFALQTRVHGPLLPGHTVVSQIPFAFSFGLGIGLHTVVVSGAGVVLMPPACDHSLAELVRRYKPEYIATAPPLLQELLTDRRLSRTRLSFLMGVFTGGAPLPHQQAKEIAAFLHEHGAAVHVRQGYGLTETVSGCAVAPEGGAPAESVGIPFPDMDVAILPPGITPADQEATPLSNGQAGVIWVSGPTVMLGYGTPSEAEPPPNPLSIDSDQRRWLDTGDFGFIDDEGFLYLLDRTERIMWEAGRAAVPGEIERVLIDARGVLSACVIPGPVPTALVVPDRSAGSLGRIEAGLNRRLSNARLSNHPATIVFCERLPRLPMGSVDYRKATQRYRHGSLPLITNEQRST